MINTTNLEEAKKLIKTSEKPVIVKAQDAIFNRKILEYGHFDIFLSLEQTAKKRGLRQIDSGFNHVLAAIAKKNNIALGLDLKEISSFDKEQKAEIISRIIQNIKIARKEGVRIIAINYKNKRDALSFMLSLGATTKQASNIFLMHKNL